MNKSFIERIFPHSPGSVLPQYEYGSPPSRSSTDSGNRISLRDRSNSPIAAPKLSRSTIQSAPLSASIVHHDDPFLPVERAAKALERTLQELIDAQSDALESTLPSNQQDDLSSVGSPTPTPSASGVSKSTSGPKIMPIRQPKPKRISLRSARKSLGKTMDEFARLKREEVRVVQAETRSRDSALRKAAGFKSKRDGLQTELEAAQNDGSASSPTALRHEAAEVEREIRELESRLFELQTRHRHLLNRAEEYENTIDSKLSSFKHSISAIERETQQFLRQPPVPCSLSNFDNTKSTRGGMYALTADRRTLEMAQEQWTTEQGLLEQRKIDAEREEQALKDGADLWRNATSRINVFEKSLRQMLSSEGESSPNGSPDDIVPQLDNLIETLENDYARAEANGWKLLMVAVGAELAALNRARDLLGGEQDVAGPTSNGTTSRDLMNDDGDANDPPDDLLNAGTPMRRLSTTSNESLKATLEQFSDQKGKGKMPMREQRGGAVMDGNDSEDDGPSADFLVSHS